MCWKKPITCADVECVSNCPYEEENIPQGVRICLNCVNIELCKTLGRKEHETCGRHEVRV